MYLKNGFRTASQDSGEQGEKESQWLMCNLVDQVTKKSPGSFRYGWIQVLKGHYADPVFC